MKDLFWDFRPEYAPVLKEMKNALQKELKKLADL